MSLSSNSPCNRYTLGKSPVTVDLTLSILFNMSSLSITEDPAPDTFNINAGLFFLFLNVSKKDEYDIEILAQRWGSTPWGYIKDHSEEWGFLEPLLAKQQMSKQPDVWIQITVPNEFQSVGKFNKDIIPFYRYNDVVDIHANTLAILNDLISYTQYAVNNFDIDGGI